MLFRFFLESTSYTNGVMIFIGFSQSLIILNFIKPNKRSFPFPELIHKVNLKEKQKFANLTMKINKDLYIFSIFFSKSALVAI